MNTLATALIDAGYEPNQFKAVDVWCPYCGGLAQFHPDSKDQYHGKDFGPLYVCKPCWVWVGCHKHDMRPKGRLANVKLRHWKKKAHTAFDWIWRTKRMSRRQAYKWLATHLGINPFECHIGEFNLIRCMNTVQICNEQKGKLL